MIERFPAGAHPSFVNHVSDSVVQAAGELDAVRKGFHVAAMERQNQLHHTTKFLKIK